ncbi:ArsR/SmtB family transcription factor [Haloarchaeobius sp. DFWS5]|uniref:ArsR/SmtB family transcription factor n=1 Tax=Haloarchaeobius sp. DFWS5 TaxID=3446114 RepID=UPI003EBD32D9
MSQFSGQGDEGLTPEEAFSLLGNETRFGILQALWKELDPPNSAPVSYSELMDRVGVRDSGNFNYHLGKLEGHFVTSTDDGYELLEAGLQVVRSVLAGTAVGDAKIEPTAVDFPCSVCYSETTMLEYENEKVTLWCAECDGHYPAEEPSGKLADFAMPPAGLAARGPVELLEAGMTRVNLQVQSMAAGVCPTCSCSPELQIRVGETGTPLETFDDPGEAVGAERVMSNYICPTCKLHWRFPTWVHVIWHPAIVSFYHQHGQTVDVLSWELYTRGQEYDVSFTSVDPIRITVTVAENGDSRTLTLDESMDVIDVE